MSYEPLPERQPLPDNVIHLTSHQTAHEPTAWDQREEPTWIDQL
jgi:hypothetical protein